MACISNSPRPGYISIENLIIKYENISYSVNNLYTKSKYVYWNITNSNIIFESDIRDSSLGILIIRNSNGIYYLVDNENIEMVFDGINEGNVNEKINNLTNKTRENVKRISQVDNNVNELNNEYGSDKDFNHRKEAFNTSIINFNGLLIALNSSLIDYLADNIFSEYEKNDIKVKFKEVSESWDASLIDVNSLIEIVSQVSEEENKDNINKASTSIGLISTYMGSLNKNIQDYISKEGDSDLNNGDANIILVLIGNIIANIESLKNTCDNMTFLGASGTISTQVTNTSGRIDSIVEKISQLQNSILNNYDDNRKIIQEYFDGIRVQGNKMDTLFRKVYNEEKDNVSVENRSYLNGYITTTNGYLAKIKVIYDDYYTGDVLSSSEKENLKNAYDDYVSELMKMKLYTVINLSDGVLSTNEFNLFCTARPKYVNSYNAFWSRLLNCMTVSKDNSIATSLDQVKRDITAEYQTAINDLRKEFNLNFEKMEKRVKTLEDEVALLKNV